MTNPRSPLVALPQPPADEILSTSPSRASTQKAQDLKDLGARVRDVRAERGITQAVLARELGLSIAYVSLIERGGRNPPYTTVVAIARVLRVPTQELVPN